MSPASAPTHLESLLLAVPLGVLGETPHHIRLAVTRIPTGRAGTHLSRFEHHYGRRGSCRSEQGVGNCRPGYLRVSSC